MIIINVENGFMSLWKLWFLKQKVQKNNINLLHFWSD